MFSRPEIDDDECVETNGHTPNGHIPGVRFLDDEESKAFFDQVARRWLNISGDEFLRAYDAGEFGDPDDDPNVMRVAMLMPFGR